MVTLQPPGNIVQTWLHFSHLAILWPDMATSQPIGIVKDMATLQPPGNIVKTWPHFSLVIL
jgi:hypothetical protein